MKCFNCPSTTNLHALPKTSVILEKWRDVIPELVNDYKSFNKLCSNHFEKNLITSSGRLLWNAVPSKFLREDGNWYTIELVPEVKKEAAKTYKNKVKAQKKNTFSKDTQIFTLDLPDAPEKPTSIYFSIETNPVDKETLIISESKKLPKGHIAEGFVYSNIAAKSSRTYGNSVLKKKVDKVATCIKNNVENQLNSSSVPTLLIKKELDDDNQFINYPMDIDDKTILSSPDVLANPTIKRELNDEIQFESVDVDNIYGKNGITVLNVSAESTPKLEINDDVLCRNQTPCFKDKNKPKAASPPLSSNVPQAIKEKKLVNCTEFQSLENLTYKNEKNELALPKVLNSSVKKTLRRLPLTKKLNFRYSGDIDENVLYCPLSAKNALKICKAEIKRHRYKYNNLLSKLKGLRKKYAEMQKLLKECKSVKEPQKKPIRKTKLN